ncbi:MAG TPA: hypothetical protein PLO41_16190 [Rubrivivax sp.]|nr:hypothetical protein [Rubrivivax sp.]
MSKEQNIRAAKPKQDAIARTAAAKAAARPMAKKAAVLGQVKTRGGKMYQVLAPAVAPQHLSMDDIERAVELMVAAIVERFERFKAEVEALVRQRRLRLEEIDSFDCVPDWLALAVRWQAATV